MITINTKGKADLVAKRIINTMRSQIILDWIIDDEDDMTLSNIQWRNKSWMRIKKSRNNKQLYVAMIGSAANNITSPMYAVYHSKFIEMLLRYFDTEIETFEVSSALIVGVDECMNMAIAQLSASNKK